MKDRIYLLQRQLNDDDWITTRYFSSMEAAQHDLNYHLSTFSVRYPNIHFRVISSVIWSKKSYFQVVDVSHHSKNVSK